MAHVKSRSSPADTAALAVMIALAAAVLVLASIYFFRVSGLISADSSSAENLPPHVIGAEETSVTKASEQETTVSETSAAPAVSTEAATSDTIVPVSSDAYGFDEEFFDDVLIIGDSLSVGLVNYGYIKPENIFAQVGLTPSSVMNAEIDDVNVYDKASSQSPEYICIMLGTNGLSYLSEDYMADKLDEFIDEISAACPDSEIALVSIPPVTAEHEREKPEKLASISKYNAHIKRLADERSVRFVDIFPLLQDSTGYLSEDYAEHDGLHLKIAAYPVILGEIQRSLTEEEEEYSEDTEETSVSGQETVSVWEPVSESSAANTSAYTESTVSSYSEMPETASDTAISASTAP